MISSPCIKCKKKNQSKDVCAKECKLLKSVQEVQSVIDGHHQFKTTEIEDGNIFGEHINEAELEVIL